MNGHANKLSSETSTLHKIVSISWDTDILLSCIVLQSNHRFRVCVRWTSKVLLIRPSDRRQLKLITHKHVLDIQVNQGGSRFAQWCWRGTLDGARTVLFTILNRHIAQFWRLINNARIREHSSLLTRWIGQTSCQSVRWIAWWSTKIIRYTSFFVVSGRIRRIGRWWRCIFKSISQHTLSRESVSLLSNSTVILWLILSSMSQFSSQALR